MPLRAGVQRLESGDQDRLAVETPVPRPLGSRCVSLLTDLKCDIQTPLMFLKESLLCLFGQKYCRNVKYY